MVLGATGDLPTSALPGFESNWVYSENPFMSILVDDYHKNYGPTIAVAGISFAVQPGEILGLVGPNGAGKTTTLRALAGILTPSSGRLIIAGHEVALEPVAAKANLAYVPDD